MKSPFYFIVKPMEGKRYSNTKDFGGVELVVSTSEEDFRFSNRFAEVIETPLGYTGPIKVGDTLVVHHNVFKFYNDMKGQRKSGMSFFREDLFFVDFEQFYMYNNGVEWIAHGRFCFVTPIKPIDSFIFKPMLEEPLMGVMKYPNEYLKSKGINAGDMICFAPDSEYEFNIDDEKMYRIIDKNITIAL
jgi:hypothetical protein